MNILKKLISGCRKKNITVSAAESCTCGYLSYLLTKTPGSSNVFKGAALVYSLELKAKLFKISKTVLKKHQGVSLDICAKLAKGVRRLVNTDLGIAIVGFADGKYGGKVFIALASSTKITAKKFMFYGSRDSIRKQASKKGIEMLIDWVKVL